MKLKYIEDELRTLRKQSEELSMNIISIKVSNYHRLETSYELYNLELQSKDISEQIKTLEVQLKFLKRNKFY